MDICDKLESMITRTVSDDMTHHEAAQIIRSLREENRELQNELVSGIHTCGPKCRKTARCTEMADLRAELAECKDLLRIASDFVERLPGHEGRTAFTDRIDAALAAKGER